VEVCGYGVVYVVCFFILVWGWVEMGGVRFKWGVWRFWGCFI